MQRLWKTATINGFNTRLAADVTALDTSIELQETTGLQAPGVLVIGRVDEEQNPQLFQREYISYETIAGNTLETVTRGLGDTVAHSHGASTVVEEVFTVTHWSDLSNFLLNEHLADGSHGTGKLIPLGGVAGNVLMKSSGSDNDIAWDALIPLGGAEGQVLVKASGADNDVDWGESGVNIDKQTIASSATPTPVGSEFRNELYITALAENATFSAPSGTPDNGNVLIIRVKDNGTARTLNWNAIYSDPYSADLPATTTASQTLLMAFKYNSQSSSWELTALSTGLPEDSGWQAVTLLNGWVNYASPWGAPDGLYIKKVGNTIFGRGLVRSGTINDGVAGTMFVLPEGWRPDLQLTMVTVSNDALGRINVFPGGNVIASMGHTNWISLCVSFSI